MYKKSILFLSATCFVFTGCMSAQQHRNAVEDTSAQALTVGKVQREIRVGMSGAEVAQILGSPNVVTTDEQRRETWLYDKISTEAAYSTSSGGVSALVLGGGIAGATLLGAGGGGGFSQSAGAASTTQKTLTVIIKFDASSRVRDFAYHSSKF